MENEKDKVCPIKIRDKEQRDVNEFFECHLEKVSSGGSKARGDNCDTRLDIKNNKELLRKIEELQAENTKLKDHLSSCEQKLQETSIMLQEMEIANKRKLEFICYLSHEFKTPLNAISGFATLLQDAELPEQTRQRYCDNILKASEHLYQVIEYAIETSRAESENIKLYPEEFNTASVINEVLCVMEEKLEEKKIKLKCDIPDIKIVADKRRFRQIIYNLVGNAYKFNSKYGKITIKTRCEKNNFFFEIKDSGCGIHPQNRSEVFNFFSDIKNDIERQGSGIGLSFCKKIINLHGGDIDVDSIPEKSTVFRFFLPISSSKSSKTMV